MDNRKSLNGQAISLMLLLCLTWSLQQIFLKLAANDITPVLQVSLRSGLSGFLIWLLMRIRKQKILHLKETWRHGLLVGFLFALEFLLVGESLHYTSVTHVVVFLYTAPIFAAIGLHYKLPSERLMPLQWLGIILAFIGIAVAFLVKEQVTQAGGDPLAIVWGDFLALLGGMTWAATTLVIRCSRLSNIPATQTLLYQLVGAFFLLLSIAVSLHQATIHPTHIVWVSLLFQSLFVSFASFLIWFWLLRKYRASELGVFSFLTPLFSAALGFLILGEPIEPIFLVSAAMVSFGIILVSSYPWLKQILIPESDLVQNPSGSQSAD